MRIASIVGARPQFIKAAPVSRVLRKSHEEILIHTGQHYDEELSGFFFEELDILTPDYNLEIGSSYHGKQTGVIMISLEPVLIKEKPDIVLVYGDTNSTLAGALTAAKLHIPVAHVEAGLRSHDKRMPEEINRVLTDHISDILFAPTKKAVENLKKEGIVKGIYNVGDVMYDSLLHNIRTAESKSTILDSLELKKKEYLLATIHRAENTDVKENLKKIIESFIESGEKIVFPAHLRTFKYLKEYNLIKKLDNSDNVLLMKPIGYLDFLKLMNHSKKILTDSGGVQKEAYFLKVPCITLRNTTEWIETVEDGWNVLVGTDKEKITEMIRYFEPKGKQRNVFGDGRASEKIGEMLNSFENQYLE